MKKKRLPRLTQSNCPIPKTRMIDKVGYNRRSEKQKFRKELKDLGI